MKHWIPDKELQNARGSMFGLDGSVSGRETSCEAPSRMPQSRSVLNEVGSLFSYIFFLSFQIDMHYAFGF